MTDRSSDAYLKGTVAPKIDTVLAQTGAIVSRATGNIAQGGLLSLFTVTGVCEILYIFGFVTTPIQNQPNATKLINTTLGPSTDLCATTDIDNDAPGTVYSITGTLANAMVKNAGAAAWEGQPGRVAVTNGTIDMSCAASSTGKVEWTVVYRPIAMGGAIVAA